MNLFKGYVASIGKIPFTSCLDEDILATPPTEGDYLGVLNEDIIQLDFDTEESANKILEIAKELKLKCDILETLKGVHLYFKATQNSVPHQYVGVFNAIGVSCDIGLGTKNRVIPLRITVDIENKQIVNGEAISYTTTKVITRKWLQTYDELDDLPCFLRPISITI